MAVIGIFAVSILYLADRHRKAGIERFSNYQIEPHAALAAHPTLRRHSERSPYMLNKLY